MLAALGSWLDARAHGGRWLVRIEDIDAPRCVDGAAQAILAQLGACGLVSDAPVVTQSTRSALYDDALRRLRSTGWTYPCACSRKDIDEALQAQGIAHEPGSERVYPGICRGGVGARIARATRVWSTVAPQCTDPLTIDWHDRRLGALTQDLTREVGDFVAARADGLYAYQLAVVVDDAAQGVTDVVRGEDLADNTPRQIHLQRLLGLPTPRYLHLALVLGADGRKLSKQNGATAVDVGDPVAVLREAGRGLGIDVAPQPLSAWLERAVGQWAARWHDVSFDDVRKP